MLAPFPGRLRTDRRTAGSFEAALQKAVRSLEVRHRDLLWEDPTWSAADVERLIREPNDLRLWALMAEFLQGRNLV